MSRMFETKEITKLLNVMIGDVEAVGETNEDNRRLDNIQPQCTPFPILNQSLVPCLVLTVAS